MRCQQSLADFGEFLLALIQEAQQFVAAGKLFSERGDVFFGQRVSGAEAFGQPPRNVDGAVGGRGFGGGALGGVKVDGERTPGEPLIGKLNAAEAMPGGLGGLENHAAIQQRDDGDHLVILRRTPGIAVELEAAAPIRVPFRIEEDDQVQPAVGLRFGVIVEVDVNVEVLPVAVLVRATAEVVGIVEQARDAGDGFDFRKESGRLDELIELPVGRPDLRELFDDGFGPDESHFVEGLLWVEGGELFEEGGTEVIGEELVDDDVAEGLGSMESLAAVFDGPFS